MGGNIAARSEVSMKKQPMTKVGHENRFVSTSEAAQVEMQWVVERMVDDRETKDSGEGRNGR